MIIGGEGNICSYMVKRLLASKHSVTVLDNLLMGYSNAAIGGEFIKGDIGDRALLKKVFLENKFDAVLPSAANYVTFDLRDVWSWSVVLEARTKYKLCFAGMLLDRCCGRSIRGWPNLVRIHTSHCLRYCSLKCPRLCLVN